MYILVHNQTYVYVYLAPMALNVNWEWLPSTYTCSELLDKYLWYCPYATLHTCHLIQTIITCWYCGGLVLTATGCPCIHFKTKVSSHLPTAVFWQNSKDMWELPGPLHWGKRKLRGDWLSIELPEYLISQNCSQGMDSGRRPTTPTQREWRGVNLWSHVWR